MKYTVILSSSGYDWGEADVTEYEAESAEDAARQATECLVGSTSSGLCGLWVTSGEVIDLSAWAVEKIKAREAARKEAKEVARPKSKEQSELEEYERLKAKFEKES